MNENDYVNVGWYSDGTNAYYISSAGFPNKISTISSCATQTPTPTQTQTPTNTETPTPTPTPTPTNTITPTSTPCFTYYLDYNNLDFGSCAGACTMNVEAQNMYACCSPISIGCVLYQDSSRTILASAGYWSDGTNCYTINDNDGVVDSISSCSTCQVIGTFNRDPDQTTACLGGGINTTLYSSDGTINIGDTVYRNSTCTLTAIEAYYSDGVTWYQVLSNGGVADSGSC
jgi:hypothetical protein